MADVTYPTGMSEELASRLYGSVEVPWSSTPFAFDESRSECRFWLTAGAADLGTGDSYVSGGWPTLVNVIRRGEDNKVRVFQWSNGLVFEQET